MIRSLWKRTMVNINIDQIYNHNPSTVIKSMDIVIFNE